MSDFETARSEEQPVSRLLEMAANIQLLGAQPELVASRRVMAELLGGEAGLDIRRQAQLRAAAGWLHVLMLEVSDALLVLAPYVRLDGSRRVQIQPEIDELAPSYQFEAAMIVSAAVNVQYRLQSNFEHGLELADRAEGLFKDGTHGTQGVDLICRRLSRHENQIWRSRLEYRLGRRSEAQSHLETVVQQLEQLYEETDGLDGRVIDAIDRVLAIARILEAAIFRNSGQLERALRYSWHALYLLSGRHARDEIRYAFALLTTARILRSHEVGRFAIAIRLLADAERVFLDCQHPFLARTYVQHGQTILKWKGADAASRVLAKVNLADIHDPTELAFVEAEISLTRTWIAEHRALHPTRRDDDKPPFDQQVLWAEALKSANEIARANAALPQSIIAEGFLHRGLAKSKLGQIDEAISDIRKASQLAKANKRIKIEIGALLALAEALPPERQPEARDAWDRARRLARDVSSAYLAEWADRLTPRFGSGATLSVRMDQTFDAALHEFSRLYLRYHDEHEGLDTGLSPSREYRLRKKFDEE